MDDPLAVERAELLAVIVQLEEICKGLRDVNARVLRSHLGKLRRLRLRIQEAQSPAKWQFARAGTLVVFKAVAAEVTKWIIETLSCLLAAAASRRRIHAEGRRVHKVLSTRGRTSAA